MNVPRHLQDAVRGVGRNALDLPVAAFAALAVAFLAFAMPGDLMTDLVGASGLPSILPAAAPPLGFKARIGVGLAGAVAVFGLVFLLLRLLDRTGYDAPKAAPTPEPAPDIDAETESPRARRRDAHPDAPAPRPILAAREFGEPAPPLAPRPTWLEPAEIDVAPTAPEARPVAPSPPEPEPEPEPEPQPGPEPAPDAESVRTAEAAPASLADLMARLERGLARRRMPRSAASAPKAPSAPAPQVFPQGDDDRLQSAIDSLQRLASRNA